MLLPYSKLCHVVLIACCKGANAYTTCRDVLEQLGETIPQFLEPEQTRKMIGATSETVQNLLETDLLEMKEMDSNLSISLKFHCLMATVAYFAKPHMLPFLSCRSIALTMKHGICKYSIIAFCTYAAVKASRPTTEDIQEASRLGKAALSCLKKRYHSADIVAQVPMVYL